MEARVLGHSDAPVRAVANPLAVSALAIARPLRNEHQTRVRMHGLSTQGVQIQGSIIPTKSLQPAGNDPRSLVRTQRKCCSGLSKTLQ
jgi:hypothetical protein